MRAICVARLRSTPFQSTPPVSGRRCRGPARGRIHSFGFNPRPPFPGGDAVDRSSRDVDRQVSIHAPRFREAMPGGQTICALGNNRFNPRPPFPGGDACSCVKSPVKPSPVSIHAPRFREAMHQHAVDALRPGLVSIHAPRFREAMPRAPCPRSSAHGET